MYYEFDFEEEKYGTQYCWLSGEAIADGDEVVAEVRSGWHDLEYGEPDEGANIRRFYLSRNFHDAFSACEECGEYFPNDDIHRAYDRRNNEVYLCESCLSDSYERCCECGEYVWSDNVHQTDRDDFVCDDCIEERDYHYCNNCGCLTDNGTWDDDDDEFYCDTCWGDREGRIHNYGYKPYPIFHKTPDDISKLFMGVELEVDKGDNRTCVQDEFDEDDVYCKEDGSLGSNGIEIVSHPRTLSSHKEYCWDDVMQTARDEGYLSHDAVTCGLHVHVNRDFFENEEAAIAKLIIIFSKWWDKFILPFSRRRESQLHWSRKPSDVNVVEDGDDEETIKEKNRREAGDRYKAVNLSNTNTIEFRVFRGTMKYSTFMATLEFVNGICEYANATPLKDVIEATAKDIFDSKYFADTEYYKNYIAERNITLD